MWLLVVALLLGSVSAEDEKLTPDEMDVLLAPIALYPDPLLAQMLPAATFPDQIAEAAKWIEKNPVEKIDEQSWDLSVRSIGHYPDAIRKMAADLEWTTGVGAAYQNQPKDVMESIQHLRDIAMANGALADSPQQQVVVEKEVIKIVPAEPDVIYVPVYQPTVVYAAPPPANDAAEKAAIGLVSFTAGLAIGAWLNNDCDWHGGGCYYHGWQGGGWVGYSHGSVDIDVNRNVYVNQNNVNRPVNVNSQKMNMNSSRNYAQKNQSRSGVPSRKASAGGASGRSGGASAQKSPKGSTSAFGGGRSEGNVRAESARGKQSRSTSGSRSGGGRRGR